MQWGNRQHPGVVDQDVQSTEGFGGGVDGMADGVGIGAVRLDGQCFATAGGDAVLQLPGLGAGADVGKGDGGAFSGQALDDGGTDAAGTALDQSNFTAEVLSGHVDLQCPGASCLG
ncbi:hypothetical protein D3C71_1831720 [compost metagenome]